MARLTLRIDFGGERAIGPGKVKLLELIDASGSISEAGRRMGMSYRRAWLLVDDLNRSFREPVVTTQPGGSRGGGAALTRFGRDLIKKYRAVEAQATKAAKRQLRDLRGALRTRTGRVAKRLKTSIQATGRAEDA
jgi:molybdate transport system regulatory protein